MLLTTIIIKYTWFPELTYLLTGNLYQYFFFFLIPHPLVATLKPCFSKFSLFVFISHTSDITQYLSFSDFTEHNAFKFRPCCCKWQDFLLVCVCVCVCVCWHVFYSFLCRWKLRLYLYFGMYGLYHVEVYFFIFILLRIFFMNVEICQILFMRL